ncbi:LysM peptidoglycan-binding domain-containing protein [Mycobacterium paraterrae]|uniref:LysM peptidoglycan-binding domain-containing protein n=1 Tax=Mycobacterium paraterrae TaxID=577492 RepID=A0ABY3VMJ4_9MYCO|nr:LysM domain-containing protein [Mycobacterium paraterrae]UMB69837.1 LysM peptidoglycan-binding domain-containing protein [Mycobacterium paraterrae]
MKTYAVQQGDTLFGIAQREYGDGDLYTVIAAQNHLPDPDVIQLGQQLLIPYVTFRHRFATLDSNVARKELTEHYYNTTDSNVELIWEIVNGVAQREIHEGAWLHIPDLVDVGHHTVVADETLEGLAARWYGDDHLAEIIALANNLPSGSALAPGQVLTQPGLNRRRHIAGDTLASLCREEYGDGDLPTRIAVVAAANRIGDPNAVFSNQTVYIPS